MSLFSILFGGGPTPAAPPPQAPVKKPPVVAHLTHSEVAAIVNIIYASIYNSGQNYVQQHYPSLWSMAASSVAILAHQAAINVVNELVKENKL